MRMGVQMRVRVASADGRSGRVEDGGVISVGGIERGQDGRGRCG